MEKNVIAHCLLTEIVPMYQWISAVSWMNGIQICPDYDEQKDIPATGDWGHEFCFQMKNGGEYTYYTVPLGEDSMLFTDESGVHYKVHNFDSHEIWDKLDYKIQTIDPFAQTDG